MTLWNTALIIVAILIFTAGIRRQRPLPCYHNVCNVKVVAESCMCQLVKQMSMGGFGRGGAEVLGYVEFLSTVGAFSRFGATA